MIRLELLVAVAAGDAAVTTLTLDLAGTWRVRHGQELIGLTGSDTEAAGTFLHLARL